MAREFAQILCSIWNSRKFVALPSDDARLFYLYLHTSGHVNNVGCFVFRMGYAAADLKWAETKVQKCMDSLCQANLIGFDAVENLVRIVGFFEAFPTTNDNHAKGCVKTTRTLPKCRQKYLLLKEMMADARISESDLLGEDFDSLSEAYGNTDTDTDTNTDTETDTRLPAGRTRKSGLNKAELEAFARWYSGEGIDGYGGYPHKVSRGAAERAWGQLSNQGVLPDEATLVAAVKTYIAQKPAETQYCNPATWLNGKRWDDKRGDAPAETAPEKPAEPPPELKGWRLTAWKALGPVQYASWIEKSSSIRRGDTVVMTVASKFMADHIRNHYADRLLPMMKAEDPAVVYLRVEGLVGGKQQVKDAAE